MKPARLLRLFIAPALVLVLASAPAAVAATAPSVSTGAARDVAAQSVTLTGVVNPHGHQTSWFFEYGKTTRYGSHTVSTPAGAGTKNARVTVSVGGLAPNTKYHYRLVAYSTAGTARGRDASFTTPKLPVTISLGATPNPVPYASPMTISGNVQNEPPGTQVVLERNTFPYTAGFAPVGNPQALDGAGNFSFPVIDVLTTSQFRVRTTTGRAATSEVITVPVAVVPSVRVTVRRHRGRPADVRFSGTATPAQDGAQIAIQKLVRGKWVTLRGATLHHLSASASGYAKTLRLRRGGEFRVFVAIVDGDHASGVSRQVHVRVR